MLADGVASAKDIDTAMVLGYKHPMGPLALTDLVGLDVRRDILLNLKQSFNDDSYTPHPLLEKLVSEGRLGKKTGMGIYDWSSGSAEETDLPKLGFLFSKKALTPSLKASVVPAASIKVRSCFR